MNLAYNAALRRRYGSAPRPPVRVGPTVVGQWARVTDPSVARLFTPQTPSFPAPAQYRNLGRWQVTFYRTRWYAKLTPFGAPISPGGTAPPPMYFVWVPGAVTLGPRGRFVGLGAPSTLKVAPSNGQNVTMAPADDGSLLQVLLPGAYTADPSKAITFQTTGGVKTEITPTIQSIHPNVSYIGGLGTELDLLLDGTPGTMTISWWVGSAQVLPQKMTATINLQGAQAAPPPNPPNPLPLPLPLPYPHLPFPLPVHLPHPPSPVPAPPTGVPAPPTGAPAPAASTTSTTTYVLLGLGAVAAIGLGYWAWRSSQARAPATAPARRAREAGEAPAAGIDRAKFERCVQDVKARGTAYNPWAVCNASLGRAARRR